ncbi:hypothetical protein [Bradyrhizobium sp. CCBAU 051011]|uniref:hypothetical protein n=1 Tax=Bradyrhizobium sp. CCBAU 051011 TaxID=858422 RepID=UPI00137B859B|nr:hypothetical protein [Bradyrhizobium sp. CCBAU 051011]
MRNLMRLDLLVDPAGLSHFKEYKRLARTETARNPDISLCLSQPRVSMEVRNAQTT